MYSHVIHDAQVLVVDLGQLLEYEGHVDHRDHVQDNNQNADLLLVDAGANRRDRDVVLRASDYEDVVEGSDLQVLYSVNAVFTEQVEQVQVALLRVDGALGLVKAGFSHEIIELFLRLSVFPNGLLVAL